MAKATKKSSTNAITAHPACPVVDLSRHLMDLWDAADASEREFNKDKALDLIGESVKEQIDDWQSALVSTISFTEAKSPAGALVQMALALDELDSLLSVVVVPAEERQVRELRDVDEHRIGRLVRSAMRAVQKSLGTEFESVRGIVKLYAGDNEESWLDNMKTWAEEGRVYRKSESDRSPRP
jgi:hypothetical protein